MMGRAEATFVVSRQSDRRWPASVYNSEYEDDRWGKARDILHPGQAENTKWGWDMVV